MNDLFSYGAEVSKEIGGPTARDAILKEIGRPEWPLSLSLYDWRNHVPASVREIWPALSVDSRLAFFSLACHQAALDISPDL